MKLRRHNKQKDILFILISSFIVVVIWIGFNLYHIWVTSTISEAIQLQLDPIDPTFDESTIQQLRSREQITPAFGIQTGSQSGVASPTPQDTPSPSPVTGITPSDTTATGASQLTPTSGVTTQGQ